MWNAVEMWSEMPGSMYSELSAHVWHFATQSHEADRKTWLINCLCTRRNA